MDIKHNFESVRQRITEAALRAGRDPRDIKLLAVSKYQPLEVIAAAYQAGQTLFAESRVQEWQEKARQLPSACAWHFVGRLQTNKVKYLDDRMSVLHSLDRFELLPELEKHGQRLGHIWTALLQVNIAEDPAKAGLPVADVQDFLAVLPDYPHVRVRGLMTIGRLGATPLETRGFFRALHQRRAIWQSQAPPGMDLSELSMGMSDDFEIAVEEGATIVRIGRRVFAEL
ncbi:MAG: YggS family pyridoxal phosphate-dependent enzyme [Peptococcaceae bacterium]|jgi:pyridoxal phosphate enzyme (YggS family)|nr:YggS family pyridoxal phosphate-dependent enzyme [Peptococcaceae bacterium]